MTDRKRERGDWQTPLPFAKKCCDILANHFSFDPDFIIEPTCGSGSFISAALETFPNVPILGIEISDEYIESLNKSFSENKLVEIIQDDYLHENRTKEIAHNGATLVLGNPPWVTNSALSAMGGSNLPKKENLKKLKGLDAITGKSNFDICEWMIEKALGTFSGNNDMLAMLCKTSVARNVCIELAKAHAHANCLMIRFDSKNVFDISAAACFFVCDFRHSGFRIGECPMDDLDDVSYLTYQDGDLRPELSPLLKQLQGTSTLSWRQGVKHDCGKVMELDVSGACPTNKLGEQVKIEKEYIYPYVKSSKSRRYIIDDADMAIPMTQRTLGEKTSHLSNDAPMFWDYLQQHKEMFRARKSSIYKNAPDFALFGVGDYAYAPYKVSVSGFYKEPIFALVRGKKPVMFDDTCYFIPFYREEDAKICMLLLNSNLVKEYLSKIAFLDSKRPFSKKVLSKIDLSKALELVGIDGLNKTAEELRVDLHVEEHEYQEFEALVNGLSF